MYSLVTDSFNRSPPLQRTSFINVMSSREIEGWIDVTDSFETELEGDLVSISSSL